MDFWGELVGERASEIVSGTSKGLLSWLSWDLFEMFGVKSLLLDIFGLEEGSGSGLFGLFNLFGEVHCFLPFPPSPVSLNKELPLGEGCIFDNETEGEELSFDVTGTSCNFFPRAL